MSTILDEKEKPTVFPLLTGGLAVGFLRLWICGHRTIFSLWVQMQERAWIVHEDLHLTYMGEAW